MKELVASPPEILFETNLQSTKYRLIRSVGDISEKAGEVWMTEVFILEKSDKKAIMGEDIWVQVSNSCFSTGETVKSGHVSYLMGQLYKQIKGE